MRNSRRGAPFDVDGSAAVVYSNDLTCTLFSLRVMNGVRPVNCVILWREAIPMDNRFFDLTDRTYINETSHPVLVFKQFVVGKFAQSEVLPPCGLILSPVVFQHLGE